MVVAVSRIMLTAHQSRFHSSLCVNVSHGSKYCLQKYNFGHQKRDYFLVPVHCFTVVDNSVHYWIWQQFTPECDNDELVDCSRVSVCVCQCHISSQGHQMGLAF